MTTPKSALQPKPERSLNQQLVLDEDEYTDALSHIIARDFFPSLVHLDATNDYLDALHSRDPNLITASVRRLQEISETPAPRRGPLQTPGQTPYGGAPSDTPLRTPRGEGPSKRLRYNKDISLDDFQARYTSEDNSSFTQILDDENRKRKEKWAWAWDAQKRVQEQRDKMIEGRERRLLQAPPATGVRETFVIEAPTLSGLITDTQISEQEEEKQQGEKDSQGGEELALQIQGEPQVESDVLAPRKDNRPAGVDGWKFRARNALMFSPDSDLSPYDPPGSLATLARSKGDPKVIKYSNTRLLDQDQPSTSRSLSAPPSPTRSRIDAAITGTPYRPRSPVINNFSLVPAMPSPTPSELGPAAVKQLMTWGTLNATPRILSQIDDPAESDPLPRSTPFHIPSPSSRETISHKLSIHASKSLRAKAELLGLSGRTPGISRTPGVVNSKSSKKGCMAPPSWTPRRADAAGSLTPAARRLLDKTTMGTAASRRAEAMGRTAGWEGSAAGKGKDLHRVRWTPTPNPVTRGS